MRHLRELTRLNSAGGQRAGRPETRSTSRGGRWLLGSKRRPPDLVSHGLHRGPPCSTAKSKSARSRWLSTSDLVARLSHTRSVAAIKSPLVPGNEGKSQRIVVVSKSTAPSCSTSPTPGRERRSSAAACGQGASSATSCATISSPRALGTSTSATAAEAFQWCRWRAERVTLKWICASSIPSASTQRGGVGRAPGRLTGLRARDRVPSAAAPWANAGRRSPSSGPRARSSRSPSRKLARAINAASGRPVMNLANPLLRRLATRVRSCLDRPVQQRAAARRDRLQDARFSA